jgi:hypothetical protein
MAPDATSASTRVPSDARALSSSSGDVVTRAAEALRMAQVMRVPGSASASRARSSRVFAAEWPAPTTVVCRPAKRAR